MTAKNNRSGNQDAGVVKLPNTKDNFGLTNSEFRNYVARLRKGDESLFTKVFKDHFHDSVAHLTYKFKISKHEAYDSCMDTMLEFRAKVLEGKIKYGNLRFLFTRMALNNHINAYRSSQKVNEAIYVFASQNNFEPIDKEAFFKVLDESISLQSDKNQKFLNTAFFSSTDLATYAENQGLNYSTLRKQKQRTLAKLKATFFEILKREKLS